jgi:hypothetical protein
VANLKRSERGVGVEARLAQLDSACGCNEGALSALVAAVLGAIFLVPSRWHPDGPLLALLELFGVILLASGLGKLAGVAWARMRARRLRTPLAAIVERPG